MLTNEIVMTERGGPEVLTLSSRELAAPAAGAAQVRVQASGVAFAEVQMLLGRYYRQPAFPFVPGYDLVGRVVAVGSGVQAVRVGDRVAAMPRTGAWREIVELPADSLVPVPEEVDAAEAVALITNGVTAWQMLHRVAKTGKGDVLLVHGAGGGVGSLLVRLGLLAGARVLGTASPAKHAALRELGAEPLDYHRDDLSDAVRELAADGVQAVFDHLGGASVTRSWRLLAPGGTLVSYGAASTNDDRGHRMTPYLVIGARMLGWTLRGTLGLAGGRRARLFSVRPNANFRTDLEMLFGLLRDGELHPVVADRYPLDKAADALRKLADHGVTGKLVLVPISR